jgi:photosystem II stability/assembly factor-like uncharacterized protein
VAYGGSQDNGREKYTGTFAWTHIQDGDGGFIRVDANNPQTVYGEFFSTPQFISLERSDDGGMTWFTKNNGIGMDATNFYTPYIIDPLNTSRLLLGTNRIYESTNKAEKWTAISSPNSAGWNTNAVVDAIASTNDPNTIYATAGGKIFVTTNHGMSWTEHDLPSGNTGRLFDIKVDPADKNTAYVVQAAFGVGHVFKTTTGGQVWLDISGNLPNIPAESILLDKRPDHLNTLYVGTDAGVYSSSDGGVTWNILGIGMPNAVVTGLDLDPTHDILAAGTYGRGLWEFTYNAGISANSPQISINDVTVSRPKTGTKPMTFIVSLNKTSDKAITVSFATQDGTAKANVDYVPTSGTLSFAPGETAKTVTVQIIGNTDTTTKTFTVNLSKATEALIARNQGTGTILPFNPFLPPDQFEPNDTSDQATNFAVLPAGTTTITNLTIADHPNGFHDVDWYRFTASQSGTLSVQIDYQIVDGTDLHIRLFRLDAAGFLHELDSSRNMLVTAQRVSAAVNAGDSLFIWIYGFNHSTGRYQMTETLA